MADIDDFDVDRSIAQAWTEFQARLSEVVSMIDRLGRSDHRNRVGDRRGGRPSCRFSAPAPRPGALRARATTSRPR